MKLRLALALSAALLCGGVAQAQTAEWRTVPAENLFIVDTDKGRVLIELYPQAAPGHVERIRTLAGRGFYDGLKFHRVIPGFMAQTGDPLGTGEGDSDLADLNGEFSFRRGMDAGFAPIANAGPGTLGLVGALPVATQPDAQMMVTVDFKVEAHGLFCPGVLGMARANAPNSANSQFFIMTGRNATLDGAYTAFGRVLSGMETVRELKAGPESANGQVPDPADLMTRARMASDLPAAERPTVRVQDVRAAAFAATVEATRTARGSQFSVCDAMPAVQLAD